MLKKPSSSFPLKVGARGSPLSKAQVAELLTELKSYYPDAEFEPIWVRTIGDIDQKTSLRTLEKTDFFTREIDEMQLEGKCRISIHSAKDLPEPLRKGLVIVALTRGLDNSDSLVLREGETLPPGAKIATSSLRRAKMIADLRPDLQCVDIRGNIETRLAQLQEGKVDGLVVAECALIRLKLTHLRRIKLEGEIAEGQGRLAVVAREEDKEMLELFQCLDARLSI